MTLGRWSLGPANLNRPSFARDVLHSASGALALQFWNQMARFNIVLVSLVASLATAGSGFCAGLSFAGVPLAPGATVRAEVPLSELEKEYLREGGNAVPSHSVAVLAVPPGFDPKKT